MNVPAKIQKVLDEMTDLGLTVTFHADDRDGYTVVHSWVISSPVQRERDAVFVYWTPGVNGGRVQYVVYRPFAKSRRSQTVKVTRNRARGWLKMMARDIATAAQ
jgi:hypothetical protein